MYSVFLSASRLNPNYFFIQTSQVCGSIYDSKPNSILAFRRFSKNPLNFDGEPSVAEFMTFMDVAWKRVLF